LPASPGTCPKDHLVSSDQAIYSAIANPGDKPNRVESVIEIAWRRRGLVVVVLFLTVMAAAIALIVIPKRITAQGRVLLVRNIAGQADSPQADLKTFLNTQAELVRSAPVLARAVEAPRMAGLKYFNGSENMVSRLKEHLDVKPAADASIIQIKLATTDPDEAQQIVQNVMLAYVDYVAAQEKNVAVEPFQKLAADREQLEAQRMDAKRMLIRLESETRAYESPDGGASTNIAIQKVRQLSDMVMKSQLETADLKTRLEQSLKTLGWTFEKYDTEALKNATAVSAQNIDLLNNNLAGLNQQLIEAKRRFVPTHPAVRTIKSQIKDLQLSQAATLKSMYEASQSREAEARKLLVEQEQIVANLDAKAAEKESLSGRIATLDKQVAAIDEKLTELQMVEHVGFRASEMEAAEVDAKSAVPDTKKTLASALVVGLVLGLFSALVREWVSPSLGSVTRIADTLGVPVLGTLPRVQGKTGRDVATLTHTMSDSPAAEAFRSIRTSMLFGSGRCNTITVTSPAPKDGKTTLATNLAISLAQSGKRVVLVDANFRDAGLHNVFDMDNAIGFTGVMSGDDLESSLRRTPIEHLDLLTAGPRVAEISEQLNSDAFTDLLRDLNLRYDHVIFDTSSVSGSNDARVIAAGCDQTILVVRGERSNRFAATAARDALLSVGALLMGIVVNDSQSMQTYPPAGDRRDPPDRMSEIAARLRATR
jgi:polysaccharide biosynthesis transport protein